MKAMLFHQPEAGETEWSADHLLQALRDVGIEARYCSKNDEGWRDCLAGSRELVIAAGGDGTVARVASAMPDRAVRLALLPLGSANNIARSLGYPDADLGRIIEGLARPRETTVHLGEARGRWGVRRFVESVGLGALARSTAQLQDADLDGPHKRASGREALAHVVRSIPPARVSVWADGEPIAGPLLLVECLNIAMIGPNLRLAEAGSGDGALTLAWLPEAGRGAMLDWLADPETRGAAPLERRSVRRVEIDAHDEPLRIDDKTVEWDGSRITLVLLPDPITVLLPEETR